MIDKIQRTIDNLHLFSRDDRLLVAISGGADSVFLFFALKELGYDMQLAHCNFNLRGKESDEDERFVSHLSKKYNLKCHLRSFDTKQYANDQNISTQMAARELRYKWFNEILEINNLDFLVTAHHKDDNVETFFINLIRGKGINSLCGIRFRNKNIIRPLLGIERIEIEQYLKENNIKHRNDTSNTDIRYVRNKIRKQLIPLIKEINPSIKQTIANEMLMLNGVNNIFQKEIDLIRARILTTKDGIYRLDKSKLTALESPQIILHEILRPFGRFNVRQIIESLYKQSGKQFLSDDYNLIIDRKYIIISLLSKSQDSVEISDIETQIETPLSIKFTTSSNFSLINNQNIATLDFNKISFPLVLRKWKSGDKFQPLGMSNFKKLSDFFIDQKYSIIDKKNQWLLCSEDDIIWIVGNRIDDRYKIDAHTKKAYIAELLI